MPVTKITSTKRGKAAVAGIVPASIGGMVALFAGQPAVHDDTALAVKATIQPWESRHLTAYIDTLATKPVWTICDGDTNNVKPLRTG